MVELLEKPTQLGMLICCHCKQLKPVTEFWHDKYEPNGYKKACKTCERIRDRERDKTPARIEKAKRWSRSDISKLHQKIKRASKEYEPKAKAYSIMHKALDNGTIEKKPCEVCGEVKVEGHHKDYSQPLAVTWLCRKHHAEIHRIE